MNRVRMWWQRAQLGWRSPGGVATRRLLGGLLRQTARLAATIFAQVAVLFASLPGRVRIGLIMLGLILLSGWTASVAPGVSEAAHGLAVLLLAGVGFWMILSAPFRQRR